MLGYVGMPFEFQILQACWGSQVSIMILMFGTGSIWYLHFQACRGC